VIMNNNCIFCKIAKKEILSETVYEDDSIIAFKDIHPLAPIHILIIPKKHIGSVDDLNDDDVELVGHMIISAKKIAHFGNLESDAKITRDGENGYKLLFRVGRWGGQEVGHIHLHLIGGAMLSEEIRPI